VWPDFTLPGVTAQTDRVDAAINGPLRVLLVTEKTAKIQLAA
jgi:hypothetical protein